MTKQQQQQQAHEDDYVKQLDPYCTLHREIQLDPFCTLHREITTRPILHLTQRDNNSTHITPYTER